MSHCPGILLLRCLDFMIIESEKRVKVQLLFGDGIHFLKSKVLIIIISWSFPKAVFDESQFWVPEQGTLTIPIHLE